MGRADEHPPRPIRLRSRRLRRGGRRPVPLIGEPREAADSAETPEGHVIRYDADEHIIGVSIVNAKWILDHDQAVALTLPKQYAAAGPGTRVELEPPAVLAEIIHPRGRQDAAGPAFIG